MERKIIKIGTVELLPNEVEDIYTNGKYIVTYSRIYEVVKTPRGAYKGVVVGKKKPGAVGFMRKGRFTTVDLETAIEFIS